VLDSNPGTDNPGPDQAAARRALEENFWSLWSRFGRAPGCILHETDDATWFDTPIPTLPYNTVIRFHAEHDADRRIDEILSHYKSRAVPCAWIVHPSAAPLDLAERLKARGLEEVEICPGMTRELGPDLSAPAAPPPGYEIEEVGDAHERMEFLNLVAWRWHVPEAARENLRAIADSFHIGEPGSPIRAWLALKNGEPMAKLLINIDKAVCGVYGVATKPEARGHGLAHILALTALHAARRAGAKRAILHSTPMAHQIYESIGFRDRLPFAIYAPPGALHL
jgi:GNAT superfamily N-acetyltransferase